MVRNKIRKTDRVFDAEAVKQAIAQVLEDGRSVNSVAEERGINVTTLRRYVLKAKEAAETNQDFNPKQNYGWRVVLKPEVEQAVVEYLLVCSGMGYGPTRKKACQIAYQTAVKNGVVVPESWSKHEMAGEDWFLNFKKRHSEITLRKAEACSMARASAFNEYTVRGFFDKVESVLNRNREKFKSGLRVFNLDETGTKTVQTPGKVIAEKGAKQVYQQTSGERGVLVTTCAIIGAQGVVYPPAMVFPRAKVNPRMQVGAYPGTLILAEKSGWMTAPNFVLVMKHFIEVTNTTPENPSLLFYDNHDSHLSVEAIDLAKDNGVTVITIPPHTSHKLQPLDVSVLGPFARQYDKCVSEWMEKNPGVTVSIYEVPLFVKQAIESAMTPANIISGFRACGIIPFNPDIFPKSAFAPSTATDRPHPSASENPEVAEGPENSQAAEAETPGEPECASLDGGTTPPSMPLSPENPAQSDVPTLDDSRPRDRQIPTSAPKKKIVSPAEFLGYPKAPPRKITGRKGRKKGACLIATDTPVKAQLAEERMKRKKKRSPRKNSAVPKKKLKKIPKKRLFDESSDDENGHVSLHEESSGSDSDEARPSTPLLQEGKFPPLKRPPQEGEFVLVSLVGKKSELFFIGKVIKELDDDGDIEVIYLRKSAKTKGKFVIPNEPEICSIPMSDVQMILPTPSFSGTKRQNSLYSFRVDFSELNMG